MVIGCLKLRGIIVFVQCMAKQPNRPYSTRQVVNHLVSCCSHGNEGICRCRQHDVSHKDKRWRDEHAQHGAAAQLKREQAEVTCGSLPLAEILKQALHSTRQSSALQAGTLAALVHASLTLPC